MGKFKQLDIQNKEAKGRLRTLKQSATECAAFLGHDLSQWTNPDKHSAVARCKTCQGHVILDATPGPGGIEMTGSAVAINCC